MKWCTSFHRLFTGWCIETDLKTVIVLPKDNQPVKSHLRLHAKVTFPVRLLGRAQSFRSTWWKQSSLFVSVVGSCCHLQEMPLHQTANQRQESVWMSVNHFSKMGYNLSPLISFYGERHTLLTFTTQHANSLPPANSFVNCIVIRQREERVQIYHSWNEACCQIS